MQGISDRADDLEISPQLMNTPPPPGSSGASLRTRNERDAIIHDDLGVHR
jgi:hypothetical protein